MPVALNLRIELQQQLGAALSPRLAETGLIQEEVDAQVCLINDCVIVYREPSDAWQK